MTDKPVQPTQTALAPQPGFSENSAAPFVYFDGVPTYGVFNGAIQLELASCVLTPGDGFVITTFRESAHLRCSPAAALALRESINKALELLEQAAANAQRAAANKLN